MTYEVDYPLHALEFEGNREFLKEISKAYPRRPLWSILTIDRRINHPEIAALHLAESGSNRDVQHPPISDAVVPDITDFMLPIPPNDNHPSPIVQQLIAENAALRRTNTQLQVRACEAEARARREYLARDMENWAYDREHIDRQDMSDWWPALRGELTDSLLLDLVKQRFAVDADLAANPPEPFPAGLPGCLPAYRRRAKEARDAELARQSSTSPNDEPGPDDE